MDPEDVEMSAETGTWSTTGVDRMWTSWSARGEKLGTRSHGLVQKMKEEAGERRGVAGALAQW